MKKFNDNTKVQVTYDDGKGNHISTVKAVREKRTGRGETEWWINNFMNNLETRGVAYTCGGAAEYKCIYED